MPSPAKLTMIAIAGFTLAACNAPPPGATASPTAEVTTAAAQLGDIAEVVTGFGTVTFDPAEQHTLSAEIEARVLDLDVRPGEVVIAGQSMLRLEPSSSASVELARARNDYVAARAASARAQRLRDDGLASDADVESADAAASDQQTLVRSLERRTANIASLSAPADGVVDAVLVAPGDLVTPGQQLVRLASLANLQATIRLEIEDAARIVPGDPVAIRSLDNAGVATLATIRSVDMRVDPTTRTTTAYTDIPTGNTFLPGQAIRAEITAELHSGVTLVPRQAILFDEAGPYVFLVTNNTASLRQVVTGITVGDTTVIASGVQPGDVVVLEGAAILSDGMAVHSSSLPTEAPQ